MAAYQTCKGCAHIGNCSRQDEIRGAIKGLGVTAVRHTCADRETVFKTGERVAFEWMHYGEPVGPYGEAEATLYAVTATVMNELTGTRYLVRVDDGPFPEANGSDDYDHISASELFPRAKFLPMLKVKTSSLKRLDQPCVKICTSCGGLEGSDMESRCQHSEYVNPNPCLLKGGE